MNFSAEGLNDVPLHPTGLKKRDLSPGSPKGEMKDHVGSVFAADVAAGRLRYRDESEEPGKGSSLYYEEEEDSGGSRSEESRGFLSGGDEEDHEQRKRRELDEEEGEGGGGRGEGEKEKEKEKKAEDPLPCLSWVQKIMFGLPQFNSNFGNALLNSWLTYYYLPPGSVPLIPASLFGTLFLVGRLLNAVCDPFFGWVSDHCTFRFGRRLPFMMVGGPLLGVFFSALFFPPEPHVTSPANTVYFCFMFAAFNVLNSFTTSPYTALLPELSGNKQERVHLATFSGVFSLLGNLLGAAIGPVQYAFPNTFVFLGMEFQNGLQLMALLAAVLHFVGYLLPLLFLREKARAQKKRTNLFKEMYIAFRNPSFISLTGMSCLLPMGVVFVVSGLPYLCSQILERVGDEPGLVRPGKGEVWVGVFSGILVGGALLWFPVIVKMAATFGKKKIMLSSGIFMSSLILLIAVVKYFPDPAVPTLIGVILLTFPAAASFILPAAIYADVVDYDEKQTGVRREGIYAGTQSFVNKCCMAVASATIVYILSLGNSAEDPLGIIVLFLVAGGIVALGTGIFFTHPIKT